MRTGLMKFAGLRSGVSLQPHQARVADTGDDESRLLLYHTLGSGKTLSALAAAEQSGSPYTAVLPASLRPNFRKEQEKWTDEQTPVQVMSYTALAQGLPARADDTLILDESHRARSGTAAQTRNAISLAEKAKRLYLLTGSPIVNHPHDLVPALTMLTRQKWTPEAFDKQFIGQRTVTPNWMARLRGVQSVKVPVLQNEQLLRQLLAGHVDYHEPKSPDIARQDERIPVDMSQQQTQLHRAFWNKLPWILRWKLQKDFPLSNKELRSMQSFLAGPRQVGLSTLPFQGEQADPLQAFDDSPKLRTAFKNLRAAGDVPTVVASNFVQAGLKPYAAALARAGVPHGMLHGGLSDAVRKRLVEDYNTGKLRTLLLGPAGTEGISLKGTRLLQILDPHWNESRGKQTAGRGIRFDSHVNLPPLDRNIRVQRYISRLPPTGGLAALLGGGQSPDAADDYLERLARRKEQLNQQFLEVLRQVGQKQGSMMYIPDTLEDAALHLARVKQAALQVTTQQKQAAPMNPDLQSGLMGAGLGAGAGGLLWLMNRRKRKTNPLGSLLTGAALGGLGGLAYQHVPKLLEATQKEIQVPPEQARDAALEKLRASAGKLKEHGVPSGINAILAGLGFDPIHAAETVKNTTGINVVPQPNSPNSEVMKEILADGARGLVTNPVNTAAYIAAPAALAEGAASYSRNRAQLGSREARNATNEAIDKALTAQTRSQPGTPEHASATQQLAHARQVESLRSAISGDGFAGRYAHIRNRFTGPYASALQDARNAGAAAGVQPAGWARKGWIRTPARMMGAAGVASTVPFFADLATRAATPTADLPVAAPPAAAPTTDLPTAPTGTP